MALVPEGMEAMRKVETEGGQMKEPVEETMATVDAEP